MQSIEKYIKRFLAMYFLSCTCLIADSQNLEAGYFTDGYTYRFQINPAIGNSRGFFAMPALGNFNTEISSTMHLSNYIYNINGRTTTFMNPSVGVDEFLKKVKDKNRVDIDLRETILAFGFKGLGGYNQFGLSVRANAGAYIPGDLFKLLKEGVSNRTYDLSNLGVRAQAWAEILLGHSHRINERLSIGANLKFLVGAGNIETHIKKAQLDLGQDSWDIVADAWLDASVKGLKYKTRYNENTHRNYVSSMEIKNPGVGGYGAAIDLGAEYRLDEDWNFGLSITDLGLIRWDCNSQASTNGEQVVRTADYIFSIDDNQANNFSDELDRIKDKISYIYELNDNGNVGKRTTGLGSNLHLAADYSLPIYRKLKFGFLSTIHLQNDYTWMTTRISANLAPCPVFSCSVNGSYGTFGLGFGWLISLHAPGFNLFAGTDQQFGKLTKQCVPLYSNATINLGLNFLF